MIPPRIRSFFRRHRVASIVAAVLVVGLSINGALLFTTLSNQQPTEEISHTFAAEWSLLDLQRNLDSGEVTSVTLATVPARGPTGAFIKEDTREALVARTRDGQDILINLDVEPGEAAVALRSLGYGRLLTEEVRENLPSTLGGPESSPLGSLLMIVMLIVVVGIGFAIFRSQRGGSAGRRADDKSGTHLNQVNRVTFADVAGCEEAKFELVEVVEFLKSPKRFTALGARIPHGIMLEGPPGTGKTLLAKAVANEAGVAFFAVSGSEFVEKYVGVGAQRVRKLFADARKVGKAVIFIDEIDAIGKKRGGPNSHDERDQTLNQLLTELDGFDGREGLIVMAASNRVDTLDEALLRPGRFSRKVDVRPPDLEGRKAILAVHARNKPMGADVNLATLARDTGSLTGAQLAEILNEAAIFAARRNASELNAEDMRLGMLKVQLGTGRQRSMEDRERAIISVHETGHAICGRVHGSKMRPQEISLYAHGAALGVTVYSQEDNDLPSETDIRAQLIALMGGRAAEDLFFHERTPGASNDFEKATQMATNMVYRWGMGRDPESTHEGVSGRGDLGFIVANREGKLPAGLEEGATRAVRAILDESYATARQTILAELQRVLKVATYLFQNERMSGDTFLAIFDGSQPVVVSDPEVANWLPVTSRPRAWGELTAAASAAAPMKPVALPTPAVYAPSIPITPSISTDSAPVRRRRRIRRPGIISRGRELLGNLGRRTAS